MNAIPSMADAPFHCPPDIVLDLPPPVSTNRLWRSYKPQSRMVVTKSPAYKQWIKAADDMLLELGQLRGIKPITGHFSVLIVLKKSSLDLDNNAKGILDFLQSRNFILDDKLCQEITLRWGDAPTGARVRLWAIGQQEVKRILTRTAETAQKVTA